MYLLKGRHKESLFSSVAPGEGSIPTWDESASEDGTISLAARGRMQFAQSQPATKFAQSQPALPHISPRAVPKSSTLQNGNHHRRRTSTFGGLGVRARPQPLWDEAITSFEPIEAVLEAAATFDTRHDQLRAKAEESIVKLEHNDSGVREQASLICTLTNSSCHYYYSDTQDSRYTYSYSHYY